MTSPSRRRNVQNYRHSCRWKKTKHHLSGSKLSNEIQSTSRRIKPNLSDKCQPILGHQLWISLLSQFQEISWKSNHRGPLLIILLSRVKSPHFKSNQNPLSKKWARFRTGVEMVESTRARFQLPDCLKCLYCKPCLDQYNTRRSAYPSK